MTEFKSDVNVGGPDDRSCVVGRVVLHYPLNEEAKRQLYDELDALRRWWEGNIARADDPLAELIVSDDSESVEGEGH